MCKTSSDGVQAPPQAGAGTNRGWLSTPLGSSERGWQHLYMRRRTLRVAARGSFAITVALCLSTVVFLGLAWNVPKLGNEFGFKGYAIAFALVLGGVGLLLAERRPPNPIGWIFCALGVIAAAMAL